MNDAKEMPPPVPLWLAAAQLGAQLAKALRTGGAGPQDAPGTDIAGSMSESIDEAELSFLEAHAAQAAALAADLDGSEGSPPDAAFEALVEGLALGADERLLLVLAAMPDLHEGFGASFAALHPRRQSRPTWALFNRLLGGDLRRRDSTALLHGSALLRLGLVRLIADGPLPERTLLLADGLLAGLQGLVQWPADLTPLPGTATGMGMGTGASSGAGTWTRVSTDTSTGPAEPESSDDWTRTAPVVQALAVLQGAAPALVTLRGLHGGVLRLRAGEIATAIGAPCFVLAGAAAEGGEAASARPGSPLDAAAQLEAVRQCLQQCLLLRAASVWLLESPPAPAVLALLLSWPAPLVLAGALPAQLAHSPRALVQLDATPPAPGALARLWQQVLPELAPHGSLLQARQAVLPETLGLLRRDLQPWLAQGQTPPLAACVAALKARTSRGDEGFAQRVLPAASWADLVLPPAALGVLKGAVQRVLQQQRVLDDWGFALRRRGARGVRLLFSGLPGTGKTLAAEVMAHALHADLLVIDLARLVSKWIGETEKNLAAAFDQAEGTGAVLFFDEADALFGKRTEVSDAHDRYANIESAYLLARLERFDGVAVLATNLRGNLDPAFLRRFEVVLEFASPGPVERAAIWRAQFPDAAPVEGDIDFDSLAAQHPLPGALIRNAALGAAFFAASAGQAIGRPHIEQALQMEYEKSGRAGPL